MAGVEGENERRNDVQILQYQESGRRWDGTLETPKPEANFKGKRKNFTKQVENVEFHS